MEVKFALLADAANSARDGKLNLLGVFDRIFAPEFPALHSGSVIVARVLFRSTELGKEFPIRFTLADQDGRQLWSASGKIRLNNVEAPGLEGYTDVFVPVTNWPLTGPGDYAVDILIAEQSKASIPLTVNIIKKETDNEHRD